MPVPGVGFTVGLTVDIPVTGGNSEEIDFNGASTTQSAFSSVLFFGATVGLLAYF